MEKAIVGFTSVDETLGKDCLFMVRDHPADHIPAEDVQNDIEVDLQLSLRGVDI